MVFENSGNRRASSSVASFAASMLLDLIAAKDCEDDHCKWPSAVQIATEDGVG
jgi:hypothetical protein